MRRDFEAAAELEAKLKKADEEARALKEEQQKIEEEKLKMAAIAAQQKQQSEDEVGFEEINRLDHILCCTTEEKGC